MVSLKQAVANAAEFAMSVLGDRAQSIQLEEVESVNTVNGDAWLITLSMIAKDALKDALGGPIRIPLYGENKRDYKTFTVIKETGEVNAMKIRELAGE